MDIDRDMLSLDARNIHSRGEIFCSFDFSGRSQIKNGGDAQVADLLHAICSCSTWIGTSEDAVAAKIWRFSIDCKAANITEVEDTLDVYERLIGYLHGCLLWDGTTVLYARMRI